MIDAKPMLAELLLVSLYEACLWLDDKAAEGEGENSRRLAKLYPVVAEQMTARFNRLRLFYGLTDAPNITLYAEQVHRYYSAWCRGSAKAKARTLAVLKEQGPPPAMPTAADREQALRRKCRRCAHYPVHGSFPAVCSGCRACSHFAD